MHEAGVAAKHVEVATPNGHDAFLVDYSLSTPQVRDFLERRPNRRYVQRGK